MNDQAAILQRVLSDYPLPLLGEHGVTHWARVLENGLRIAKAIGADGEVVALFAIFHDARRVNQRRDDGHGERGGALARSLRGSLINLDDVRFELLYEACRVHSNGQPTEDPTIAACWDADRLDLGRVNITTTPSRLCTDAAREILGWAQDRAIRKHEPRSVLQSWGIESASQ